MADRGIVPEMAAFNSGHRNEVHRAGELAESNAAPVERTVRFAEELGRPVATPGEARSILGP